jgi:ribosome production factor 2
MINNFILNLFSLLYNLSKRPHNLVLGRTFDYHLLDMFELGVEQFESIESIGRVADTPPQGNKPCMLFIGEEWETKEETRRLGNLLLDFFRGHQVSEVDLSGLDHCMCFYANGQSIVLRSYKIIRKRSGTKVNRDGEEEEEGGRRRKKKER